MKNDQFAVESVCQYYNELTIVVKFLKMNL